MTLAGDTQPSPLVTACDPTANVLIVDYKTRVIESINHGAVLETYETPN